MSKEQTPHFGKTVENAILNAFQEHGMFITGFALAVETYDEKGERSFWVGNLEGMTPWTVIGLLRYGLTLNEQGGAVFCCCQGDNQGGDE